MANYKVKESISTYKKPSQKFKKEVKEAKAARQESFTKLLVELQEVVQAKKSKKGIFQYIKDVLKAIWNAVKGLFVKKKAEFKPKVARASWEIAVAREKLIADIKDRELEPLKGLKVVK